MRGRAFRRHHERRIKEKVKKFVSRWLHGDELANNPRFIGRLAKTPHPSSCRGCGHQRKWEGKTIQEQRAPTVDEYYEEKGYEISVEDFCEDS